MLQVLGGEEEITKESMTKKEFDIYKYSINTQVKFRGEWQGITEVWFIERKIGLLGSGHIINYDEVEDIKY